MPGFNLAARPEAVLDPACLDGLRDLSASAEEDVLSEVVALYRTLAPGQLAAVRTALAREDGPALRDAAHSLRGSSAQFGAREMQNACAALEEAGRGRWFEGGPALLAVVEDEFQRLTTALADLSNASLP